MQERRRYIRLEEELPLTFERKGPSKTLRGEGTTRNVSPTGICFMTGSLLGVGEKIVVTLPLPKVFKPVSLEARVVWFRPAIKTSLFSHEVGVALSPKTDIDQSQYLLFICDILCEQLKRQELL